jgi:hypothetical protein
VVPVPAGPHLAADEQISSKWDSAQFTKIAETGTLQSSCPTACRPRPTSAPAWTTRSLKADPARATTAPQSVGGGCPALPDRGSWQSKGQSSSYSCTPTRGVTRWPVVGRRRRAEPSERGRARTCHFHTLTVGWPILLVSRAFHCQAVVQSFRAMAGFTSEFSPSPSLGGGDRRRWHVHCSSHHSCALMWPTSHPLNLVTTSAWQPRSPM